MKRLIALLLVASFALLFMPALPACALSLPSISAKSAVLIEAESGKVLFGRSENTRLPMASTTKIMTAITAIEHCDDLDALISVDKRAVGIEGSSVYLYAGERISMRSLLYALLLSSANDAAAAIAFALCGSVEGFADLMNGLAARLGLSDTHFTNPHGLHDDQHYTTARELAIITAYALKNPTFKEIVSTKKATLQIDTGESSRYLVNHNKLLSSYRGAIGVKTGFTKKAGRCLVSAAERDGMTLIAVTLNAPDDWRDHTALLDFGFDSYERISLDRFSCELPVIGGLSSSVRVASSKELSVFISRARGDISTSVLLPRFVYADIKEGEVLGEIIYRCDGKIIASSPIVATESVSQMRYKKNLFEWLASLFGY